MWRRPLTRLARRSVDLLARHPLPQGERGKTVGTSASSSRQEGSTLRPLPVGERVPSEACDSRQARRVRGCTQPPETITVPSASRGERNQKRKTAAGIIPAAVACEVTLRFLGIKFARQPRAGGVLARLDQLEPLAPLVRDVRADLVGLIAQAVADTQFAVWLDNQHLRRCVLDNIAVDILHVSLGVDAHFRASLDSAALEVHQDRLGGEID